MAKEGGRAVGLPREKFAWAGEGDNRGLEVPIMEGRNRQVRKMFEEVGHHVEKIRRVQYGPLALDVPPGDWRNLTLFEVAKLKSAASVAPPSLRQPQGTPSATVLLPSSHDYPSARPPFGKLRPTAPD